MVAILQSILGPGGNVRAPIERGRTLTVGRLEACNLSISADSFLSGRHFELRVIEDRVHLRDLESSNGTFVNGIRVREHFLSEQDIITAGRTSFRILLEEREIKTVVEVLSDQQGSLFAVLDTARDPSIYPLVIASGLPYWCLYQGQAAQELEAVAPYLVYLSPRCEFLATLVSRGWGESWGIFLTSSQAVEVVWHELRRSLFVMMPDGNQEYFRFYDPRVLRTFIPMLSDHQRAEFSGTVNCFLIEGDAPDSLLRFHSLKQICGLDKLPVQLPRQFDLPVQTSPANESASTQLIPTL